MNNEEVSAMNNNEQSACDSTIPATSDSVRAKKFTKKTDVINRRKRSKCSVCKKTMRSDSIKRHLIRKHSGVLNSNQVKKVIWGTRCRKDYHKSVSCGVCKKTMRSDHLKRHITAKHNDVLNTVEHQMKPTDVFASKPATNGKIHCKSYDRKVTNATSFALTAVTSALHWAFKHVHDETVTLLERNGERDASKRITNLLVPVEEELANMIDQELFRVANVLILEQPKPNRYESEQLY